MHDPLEKIRCILLWTETVSLIYIYIYVYTRAYPDVAPREGKIALCTGVYMGVCSKSTHGVCSYAYLKISKTNWQQKPGPLTWDPGPHPGTGLREH